MEKNTFKKPKKSLFYIHFRKSFESYGHLFEDDQGDV